VHVNVTEYKKAKRKCSEKESEPEHMNPPELRVTKRRRTDDQVQDSTITTPAAFIQPLHPAGAVLPFPLKNRDGSDWTMPGQKHRADHCEVVCAHDGGWFVACFRGIVRVSSEGLVWPIAGDPDNDSGDDGVGRAATFGDFMHGLALSADGATLFVVDTTNNKIRRVDIASGAVSTLAGNGQEGNEDGAGTAAQFSCPAGCTNLAACWLH